MSNMIISISGKPGSGKSSVAQAIAEHFGLERFYMGQLWREKSREKGLTLLEGEIQGESDETVDKEIDEYQRKLGQTRDNFVIEGRTSFYFIPHSYKIYLDVDVKEGAKRIWHDLKVNKHERNEDKDLDTIEKVELSVRRRIQSYALRYKKFYNIQNADDPKHYDYVLDTTRLGKEEVIRQVIEHIQNNVVRDKK
ncbi:MAG: (d)CMP kinase [bacterium]|nr:(d)CMP kinase [bacterium]